MKVGKTVKSEGADYVVENVNKLAQVIPEIWGSGIDCDAKRMKRTKSELDRIIATAAVGAQIPCKRDYLGGNHVLIKLRGVHTQLPKATR